MTEQISWPSDDVARSAGQTLPPGLATACAPTGSPQGWPPIDTSLLDDSRPLLPAFPVDVLPSPWRVWVETAARGAGAPVDYVGQALLAAAAGLAGAGLRVSVRPSWSEPLVLWQV